MFELPTKVFAAISTGKWGETDVGWPARVFLAFVTLIVLGYVFDFVMVVLRGLTGVKSSFTSDPLGFLNKSVDRSNLSHRDNFSRDPTSAGSSVDWPPSNELLEANSATSAAWGGRSDAAM